MTVSALQPQIREQIMKIANEQNIPESRLKVFARESPVININANRSIPSWASGAAVEKTIGPLLNVDGRRVWYDFFKVEKLVAIYTNGTGYPPLLFNINVNKLWPDQNTALLAPAQKQYVLDTNSSIWINSSLLAANAPAGKYTGLTIASGTIDINEMPVVNAGKTTITANAQVTVKLKLHQQTVTDADLTSVYGQDAREADYSLPDVLEFQFSSVAGSKISAVGSARSMMFGQTVSYQWTGLQGIYEVEINQVAIAMQASESDYVVTQSSSPFTQFSGKAVIITSFWGLPVADLDLSHISPAAGIGSIGVICQKGITATWTNLQHGPVQLNQILISGQPGLLGIATSVASNIYARQRFLLWKDKQNPNASSAHIGFGKKFKFGFFSATNGNEVLEAVVNAAIDADRPIDVSARPIPVQTKDSFFVLMANKSFKAILLYDNNIVLDNYVPDPAHPLEIKTMSLALENALFTTSPVNGCFLAGELDQEWKKVNQGMLYTSFAVYKYIPMLPDPYAANIDIFQKFTENRITDIVGVKIPVMILLAQVKFGLTQPGEPDNADTNFHLLPFNYQQYQQQGDPAAFGGLSNQQQYVNEGNNLLFSRSQENEDSKWTRVIDTLFKDDFSLLDVSSHANQMGISFGSFGSRQGASTLLRYFAPNNEGENVQSLYDVPFKIDNGQMTSPSLFTRSFVLPQIAWEPVHNLTAAQVAGDPPKGMNFYPDDGGATRIFNNSVQYVPLAPKPVIKDIIRRYKEENGNLTWSYFTLPFGLKALAVMSREQQSPHAPKMHTVRPVFSNDLRGGIQVQCDAGKLKSDKFPTFNGATTQLPNILDENGSVTNTGTLGNSVSTIFNKEFSPKLP
ncbi:MAG: hypothetical protein H0X41_08775, partial [Chitinophagaceae bacterium]|nr:hypothetical protein [Chitinophagaceae bacterium]